TLFRSPRGREPEVAREHGAHGQHHEREGHREPALVRLGPVAWLAGEGEEIELEGVEGGRERGEREEHERRPRRPGRYAHEDPARVERRALRGAEERVEDLVFREEPRREWHARERHRTDEEGGRGDGHLRAEPPQPSELGV